MHVNCEMFATADLTVLLLAARYTPVEHTANDQHLDLGVSVTLKRKR
jgi:hypothetical protein